MCYYLHCNQKSPETENEEHTNGSTTTHEQFKNYVFPDPVWFHFIHAKLKINIFFEHRNHKNIERKKEHNVTGISEERDFD